MKEDRGLEQKQIKSTLGTWLERLRSVRVAQMPQVASRGEVEEPYPASIRYCSSRAARALPRQGGREDSKKGQGQIHVSTPSTTISHRNPG